MVLSVQLFFRLNYEGENPSVSFLMEHTDFTSSTATTKTSITLLHACLDDALERGETVTRLIFSESLFISLSQFTLLGSVYLFSHFLSVHLSQFLPASVCFLFLFWFISISITLCQSGQNFPSFFFLVLLKHKLNLLDCDCIYYTRTF